MRIYESVLEVANVGVGAAVARRLPAKEQEYGRATL